MYPYWYPMYRYNSNMDKMQDECKAEEEKKCKCPEIGDTVPDFKLEGVMLGKRVEVSLSDYRGKWLLLLFYPGDFTFV
jgi:hypothetical protein